ncbi:MAG: hypothetical protein PHQ60_01295 [Sideroxydans sp.]|nr:hypothetical protein [Sideroxydans sp.]
MNWSDNKLIHCISKHASGRNVLLFLLLNLAMTVVMNVIAFRFGQMNDGMLPLDVTMFYGVQTAAHFFGSVPDAAAHFYLWLMMPLDVLYIPLYSFSFALIVVYLLQRLARRGHVYPQWLVLYPFAAGLCDYLENFGFIALFNLYPAQPQALLYATTMASALKWLGAFSGLSILLYLVFKWVITRPQRQRSRHGA